MGFPCVEEYKPCLAMVVTQCIYAAMAVLAEAAFADGMSPMVFVVYRQAIATVILIPATIFAKGGRFSMALGLKALGLVFVASLIGGTLNQYLYYNGLHFSSSSMASAMLNLVPAITFVMAACAGLEKVELRNMRSMAKVIGTVICVGGAVTMAFFKGPELLNLSCQTRNILTQAAGDRWLMGGLLLIGGSCCWSFWLILQVPICRLYVDPLSLSAWMCLLSTIQAAILTIFVQPNSSTWQITSLVQLSSCLFSGIFGSGVTYYLQSWSISVRGPLYSAMFNPLCTVITTVFASIVLHQGLHIGSLAGAIAIIGGLYIVLWGKAEDLKSAKEGNCSGDPAKVAIAIDSPDSSMTEPMLGT